MILWRKKDLSISAFLFSPEKYNSNSSNSFERGNEVAEKYDTSRPDRSSEKKSEKREKERGGGRTRPTFDPGW